MLPEEPTAVKYAVTLIKAKKQPEAQNTKMKRSALVRVFVGARWESRSTGQTGSQAQNRTRDYNVIALDNTDLGLGQGNGHACYCLRQLGLWPGA
jgi:hypothetical protein